MATAKACGKIILFGEHAVVYGKPGIAVPVKELWTKVEVNKASNFKLTYTSPITEQEKNKSILLLNFLFLYLNLDRKVNIKIKTNIQFSSGFGSSASLSVALVKALSKYFCLEQRTNKYNKNNRENLGLIL